MWASRWNETYAARLGNVVKLTASEAAAFASVVETSENFEGDHAIESQAAG